jgi:ATP-dependent Clp protease ATP-binding subunit ClpB
MGDESVIDDIDDYYDKAAEAAENDEARAEVERARKADKDALWIDGDTVYAPFDPESNDIFSDVVLRARWHEGTLTTEVALGEGAPKVEAPNLREVAVLEVTDDEIAEVVSSWTGVPVSKMMQGEMDKLRHLEDELHKRVVGQNDAVTAVASAVRRSRAGLSDPNRPIGSFFFLGPTGVGKTELAKALAESLFDDERALVRIDMSEYMEKHSVARLIGAPPGYVGYDEGGQLTEAVRRRPYSVILLDEMEKAHPDVFNVLLQLLDDGRLTDGQGRVVSFKNTIVIMTSNVGSQFIAAANQAEDPDDVQRQVNDALRQTFKPEFLNRIDDVVVFHALGLADIERIVDIQLQDVRARLDKERITLVLSPAAVQSLAFDGLDPVYGARPLKRLIQRQVVDNVANLIIAGEVTEGDTVLVDVGPDDRLFATRDDCPNA